MVHLCVNDCAPSGKVIACACVQYVPNVYFLQDTWEDILIGDVEMKGTVCCGR